LLLLLWPAACHATRADRTLAAMTEAEKLGLVTGAFGAAVPGLAAPPAAARPGSAGYVAGVPRLGIPPQWETDGGMGVATQMQSATRRPATALPSGLATAATWDPGLAFRAGAMIGAQARAGGFDVVLAGGVNLTRDPRGGRTFEYAGEDPLLAGRMVGAEIAGIQSNQVIATVKHYAFNDQETGRTVLSAGIGEAAARESDLLAFELAIERGDPGAVMCAYNRVNGVHACQNDWLLTTVLKRSWGYRYYVMSDWGAVHATAAALAGLDQESAAAFDGTTYFGAALGAAVEAGRVPASRLDDMARRILLALYDKGVVDHPPVAGAVDFAAGAAVSGADAAQSIVLLKNAGGVLPLRRTGRIAVIGGHADAGVLSGGGSSQVYPPGGNAVPTGPAAGFPGAPLYDPSPPLAALRALMPAGTIGFASGADPEAAARLAAAADVAIVFATSWSAESRDTGLSLPDGQDTLIDAVARANPRTVVVLETGGPVTMPWLDRVAGVVEAWYPGSAGGEAIARVLFGVVDASGRLPVTFPRGAAQLPAAAIAGSQETGAAGLVVRYAEGAAVGYKWFDRTRQDPLFPFGFGLSYGQAGFGALAARRRGGGLTVTFDAWNRSARRIAAVPEVYVSCPGFDDLVTKRLAGWEKLWLEPGARRRVSLAIDPRLLGNWSVQRNGWVVPGGTCAVLLATSARAILARAFATVPPAVLARP
jgi:beta-glucosidase